MNLNSNISIQRAAVVILVAIFATGSVLITLLKLSDTSKSTIAGQSNTTNVSTVKSQTSKISETLDLGVNSTVIPNDSTTLGVSNPGSIVIVGDSLLHQTDAPKKLLPALVEAGWSDIYVDAQGCRPSAINNKYCLGTKPLVTMLDEAKSSSYKYGPPNYEGGDPQVTPESLRQEFTNSDIASAISNKDFNKAIREAQVIVIALGTNDDEGALSSQAISSIIQAVRSLNPDSQIYWTRICAKGVKASLGKTLNPLLDKQSKELNFNLIDWDSKCVATYQTDGIHYNEEGAQAYIDTIVSSLK